jgi:hypothetical protein
MVGAQYVHPDARRLRRLNPQAGRRRGEHPGGANRARDASRGGYERCKAFWPAYNLGAGRIVLVTVLSFVFAPDCPKEDKVFVAEFR